MKRADAKRRWREASTLAELGELTALWLEGRLSWHPCYGNRPDPETAPLVPALARLNRAGFVTEGSQPGHPPLRGVNGAMWEQRATVSGFATPKVAGRVERRARGAGLLTICHDGASRWFNSNRDAVLTTRYRRNGAPVPTCGFGGRMSRREVELQFGACGDAGLRVLFDAVQVTVIDPEWGRVGRLWSVLRGL